MYMLWLTDFFTSHMIEIFFIYGLGFFIMGIAVALESEQASALPLARAIPWLAGFGLLHALAEWMEMAIRIGEMARDSGPSLVSEAVTISIELASFLWLLKFGCELLALQHTETPPAATATTTPQPRPASSGACAVRRAILAVLAVFALGMLAISVRVSPSSILWVKLADVWTSYAVAIPAFVLTIYGLVGQSRSFRAQGWPEMSREMTGAAIAFCWYAAFDSIFVAKIPYLPASLINSTVFLQVVGIPIELFRAANALVIAVFFIRALRIFSAEDRRRLHSAIETQRRLQSSAEALNRELRGAAKEMSALYDQLSQRDEVHSHLLNRVVRAQEEERRRVARDLHDGVGQTLSGLAAGLAALESRFQEQGPTTHMQIEQMKTYAMQSVEELHRVVTDLRPSLLDDLGLVAALRWYARQYSETLPLVVTLDVHGKARRLAPEVEIVLFRIAQEALSNVVRHARANRATLRLNLQTEGVTLEVEDDGIGFDPQAAFAASGNSRPWGLLGMQERAALVSGTVDIQSQAWQGSKVTVTIPLQVHAAKETEQ